MKKTTTNKKYFIKCDCCNSKIYVGNNVYIYSGFAGVFCSAECFASSHGEIRQLGKKLIENNLCTVYEEKEITTTSIVEKEVKDIDAIDVYIPSGGDEDEIV